MKLVKQSFIHTEKMYLMHIIILILDCGRTSDEVKSSPLYCQLYFSTYCILDI